VYFGEFDMKLEPTDDQPGFVVGEFRLNGDGWFNYFGFVAGDLACTGNEPGATDFGAPKSVSGTKSGHCAGL